MRYIQHIWRATTTFNHITGQIKQNDIIADEIMNKNLHWEKERLAYRDFPVVGLVDGIVCNIHGIDYIFNSKQNKWNVKGVGN